MVKSKVVKYYFLVVLIIMYSLIKGYHYLHTPSIAINTPRSQQELVSEKIERVKDTLFYFSDQKGNCFAGSSNTDRKNNEAVSIATIPCEKTSKKGE